MKTITKIILFLLVIAGTSIHHKCTAQTNPKDPRAISINCDWISQLDTIKIQYVVLVSEDGTLKAHKGDYIVNYYEVLKCNPPVKFPDKRNEKIIFEGKPVEPVYIKTK